MEELINVIVWAAIIQGLFLGLLYIFSSKSKSKANRILGFFLICFVFEAMTSSIIPYNFIGSYNIGGYFTLPEVKLLFPILFLHYIVEKLGRTKHYIKLLRFHYWVVGFIFCITIFNLLLFFIKDSSIHELFSQPFMEGFFYGFQNYAFILTVLFFVISILETMRYKKVVQNEFTDVAMLQISWLWQFIFILLPVIVLWGIELGRIALAGTGQSEVELITWGFITLFIYFVSYKAFKNQNLFERVPEDIMKEVGLGIENHLNHRCSEENSQSIIIQMEANSFYLNPDLNIHTFAKEIKMSPRMISSCINRIIGVNFNEWVNNYRVENALKKIQSDSQNLLSIEGIGMDSGFKSRSAMYTAFKKKTGHSPGHFRNV